MGFIGMRLPFSVLMGVLFAGCILSLIIANHLRHLSRMLPMNQLLIDKNLSRLKLALLPFFPLKPCRIPRIIFLSSCQRSYPWSDFTSSNIMIETPPSCNSTTASMSFFVANPNLNETTIVNVCPL